VVISSASSSFKSRVQCVGGETMLDVGTQPRPSTVQGRFRLSRAAMVPLSTMKNLLMSLTPSAGPGSLPSFANSRSPPSPRLCLTFPATPLFASEHWTLCYHSTSFFLTYKAPTVPQVQCHLLDSIDKIHLRYQTRWSGSRK
jgi:hypothetical protein